jgi:hypothetical protein
MRPLLLDILIDHLREHRPAVDYVRDLSAEPLLSAVTIAEVYVGPAIRPRPGGWRRSCTDSACSGSMLRSRGGAAGSGASSHAAMELDCSTP